MSAAASDRWKRAAAARALDLVEAGMRLGLGSGSTADHFTDLLGARVRAGLRVVGVATSERTRARAEAAGVPLAGLDDHPELDLTVDGADEVDPALRLIKGGGGALLREKIVAAASRRMVVVADGTKRVGTLGAFPLPLEIVPFGLAATRRAVERAAAGAGCAGPVALRMEGAAPFVTDGGHLILDAALGAIPDPERLSAALHGIPGLVEHGLFIGLAGAALIGDADGVAVMGRLD